LPPVDGDADLGHSRLSPFAQHAPDAGDRGRETLRHLAVGVFERPGPGYGMVELAGKPGAVIAKGMDLCGHRLLAARGLAPALGGSVKRVERLRQTPARSFNRIGLAHAAVPAAYRMGKL